MLGRLTGQPLELPHPSAHRLCHCNSTCSFHVLLLSSLPPCPSGLVPYSSNIAPTPMDSKGVNAIIRNSLSGLDQPHGEVVLPNPSLMPSQAYSPGEHCHGDQFKPNHYYCHVSFPLALLFHYRAAPATGQ